MPRDKTIVTISLFNDTAIAIKSWCNQNDITFNQIMRQITDEWKTANIKDNPTICTIDNAKLLEKQKNFCVKCQEPVDTRYSYEMCKKCATAKRV
jgi:arsenate reductase-like glutaredoxin family protein